MKKSYFYFGILALIISEILADYLIIPLPGSQDLNSLNIAYILYHYRWIFRILIGAFIIAGIGKAFAKNKWLPPILILLAAFVVYTTNVKMTAEAMFHQPSELVFAKATESQLPGDALVIGVENNGEAKAYPIRYLAYHHQIQDVVGGKKLLITYCDVCHSGYVFEPVVNGHAETFRLAGMNRFNAMLEDQTTKSWWRQTTGEAIAGELKGQQLPYFPSQQMTLSKWVELHPNAVVMQPDKKYKRHYDSAGSFEKGKDTDELTRTDTASWKNKSLVIGVQYQQHEKAYDWNELKSKHVINDTIGTAPIVLAVLSDQQNFVVFLRPDKNTFTLQNDSLFSNGHAWSWSGASADATVADLKPIPANQLFWHTWTSFHPRGTRKIDE